MAKFLELLLKRTMASTDEPPPPSGGQSFGANAPGKKRTKGDFRGLLLSNQTHRSSSDGEARLFKKAPVAGAYLSFLGLCVMENRIAPQGAPIGATALSWPVR